MPRIERVGVLVHLSSADEYRAQLRAWSEEARAAGDTGEVLSPAEIEQEVASRDGYFDFDLRLFALLADGTQVVTDGGSWGFSVGAGGIINGDEDTGRSHPRARWAPSLDTVEARVRDGITLDQADRRWMPLLQRLRAAGAQVSTRDLDALPLGVEFTEPTRDRLGT